MGKDRIDDEDQRKIAKQFADLVAVTNLEIPHNSIRDSSYWQDNFVYKEKGDFTQVLKILK